MHRLVRTATRLLGTQAACIRATRATRLALGLIAALALVVPAPVLATPACALGLDSTDCARCQAKQVSRPAPACHAPKSETTPKGCHETDAEPECCRLKRQGSATPSKVSEVVPTHTDGRPLFALSTAGLAPSTPDVETPHATGGPPGLEAPQHTRTTILRL